MQTITRRGAVMAALIATLGCVYAQQGGQGYPNRPVKLLLPYPAGGPTDTVGRLVGQKLSEALGKPVVVENRGGAGGVVGATAAARSAPDGYTLFLGGISSLATDPFLHKSLPYDPLKDFRAVSLATRQPVLLVVNPSVPIKSLQELVAFAKANPGNVNFGSSGIGTSGHLSGEMFRQRTGVAMVHIPYSGGGAVLNALQAGEIQAAFVTPLTATPLVRAGKIRVLAVSGEARSPALPDAPTFAEAGLKNYDATTFNGFLVPTGTPESVVTKLNAALVTIMKSPEVAERLRFDGSVASPTTPDEFEALIRAEQKKWSQVIKTGNIKIE